MAQLLGDRLLEADLERITTDLRGTSESSTREVRGHTTMAEDLDDPRSSFVIDSMLESTREVRGFGTLPPNQASRTLDVPIAAPDSPYISPSASSPPAEPLIGDFPRGSTLPPAPPDDAFSLLERALDDSIIGRATRWAGRRAITQRLARMDSPHLLVASVERDAAEAEAEPALVMRWMGPPPPATPLSNGTQMNRLLELLTPMLLQAMCAPQLLRCCAVH